MKPHEPCNSPVCPALFWGELSINRILRLPGSSPLRCEIQNPPRMVFLESQVFDQNPWWASLKMNHIQQAQNKQKEPIPLLRFHPWCLARANATPCSCRLHLGQVFTGENRAQMIDEVDKAHVTVTPVAQRHSVGEKHRPGKWRGKLRHETLWWHLMAILLIDNGILLSV